MANRAVALALVVAFLLGVLLLTLLWTGLLFPAAPSPTQTYPTNGNTTSFVFQNGGSPALFSVELRCTVSPAGPCGEWNRSGLVSVNFSVPSDALYSYRVVVPSGWTSWPSSGTLAGGTLAVTTLSLVNQTAATQRNDSEAAANRSAALTGLGYFVPSLAGLTVVSLLAIRISRPYMINGIPVRRIRERGWDQGDQSESFLLGSPASWWLYEVLKQVQASTYYENAPDVLCEFDVVLLEHRGRL